MPTTQTPLIWAALTIALASSVLGCRGTPSDEPPIIPIRNMYGQPRYNPQARSGFFQDERTMRPLVAGVIAQEMGPDAIAATGWSDVDQSWALTIPQQVIGAQGGMERLVERGQDRFGIYCTPCHGQVGDGAGAVPQRAGGPIRPPTLHDDRLRHAPDGQIFATISRGVRNMPAYEHAIPAGDRWAIVAYVRALQMSQGAEQHAVNLPTDR